MLQNFAMSDKPKQKYNWYKLYLKLVNNSPAIQNFPNYFWLYHQFAHNNFGWFNVKMIALSNLV